MKTMKSEIIDSLYDFDYLSLTMPLITVYYNTIDFPGKYVARLFDLQTPTIYAMVKGSLEEIRAGIPPVFCKLERFPDDDPNIIEVWL